jgi:hypothetical protein
VLSRSHPFPLLDPLPHPSLKPLERHKWPAPARRPEVSAAPRKSSTKQKASTTQCAAKPTLSEQLVTPPAVNPSAIEEISDLLDSLPMDACAVLTRRLLSTVPSHPSGLARSWGVLKTVFVFVAEYGRKA